MKKSLYNLIMEAGRKANLERVKSDKSISSSKWVVNAIGAAGSSVEISVLLDSFSHGFTSWGWEGNHKIVVHASSREAIDEFLFNELMASAQRYADHLNSLTVEKLSEILFVRSNFCPEDHEGIIEELGE